MAYLKKLGLANYWESTPEIVKKCRKLGHMPKRIEIGRCLSMFICKECRYSYEIDSSD